MNFKNSTNTSIENKHNKSVAITFIQCIDFMSNQLNRRSFNKQIIKGIGGLTIASSLPMACAMAKNEDRKLGVALVGLGYYSQGLLAPALQETKHCKLTAIVTGTKAKEEVWSKQYDIPKRNIYNYENFDDIADNKEVDIVYVVLPNSMHADFSIRAAKAGKHVICEKPMAVSVEECDSIISACKQANVKLSVGYRLQSEPYTQEVKRLIREETFGKPRYVSAEAAYVSGNNWDQWRFNKKLSGGGALMNMGVYAIQGAIYGVGENPIAVTAQEFSTMPQKYKDTDETITAQLEFPGGTVANIFTSHHAKGDRLYVSAEKGWFELDKAFSYGPLHGRTSEGKEIVFPHTSQQALQMDDFASHILNGTENKAPGKMGLRDMKIVEAIYQSIAKKKRVAINL